MSRRVQVILDDEDVERFRRLAARRGVSLSAWLREAGRQRQAAEAAGAAIGTLDELDAFFAACDQRESGREPDWEEHLRVITRSRGQGW